MFTDKLSQLPQKRPQSKSATLLPRRRLPPLRRRQRLQAQERDDPPWSGAQQPRLHLSVLSRARTQISATGQSSAVCDAVESGNQGGSLTFMQTRARAPCKQRPRRQRLARRAEPAHRGTGQDPSTPDEHGAYGCFFYMKTLWLVGDCAHGGH
jgi:hypothetical protein